jgi:GAF domain-containing protein
LSSARAGAAGDAVGLAFSSGEGIAGYVFTTGQPLAVADVIGPALRPVSRRADGRCARSILAVPLLDDSGASRWGAGPHGDQGWAGDLDLASAFARQAAVAIRASRGTRCDQLLRLTLARLAADPVADSVALDAAVAEITLRLDDDEGARLWALADAVARARRAAPDQVALIVEILDALARRGSRPAPRSFRR